MLSFKRYIYALDLFQPPEGAAADSEHQKRTNLIATRIYLLLLLMILVGLTLALTLLGSVINITIEDPTQSQLELFPNAICPCSQIFPLYSDFVSTQSSFHQVCSSDFITDQWISSLYFGINSTYFLPMDIRSLGVALFQALSSFCRLSQANFNQSVLLFNSTSLLSPFVVSEYVLQSQVQTFQQQFQSTIFQTLQMNIELISNIISHNDIMNGLGTAIYMAGSAGRMTTVFNIYVLENGTWCTCMEDVDCYGSSGIYQQFDVDTFGVNDFNATILIPGLSSGCMPVDACLHSTLECFFNQTCVNEIVSYLNTSNANFTAMSPSSLNHFNISSTIVSIVNELMIDEWKLNVSYDKYFATCAPLSCTFSTVVYHNFFYVLSTLIGLLGGLCTGMGTVVPYIVGLIQRPRTNTTSPKPHISCELLQNF